MIARTREGQHESMIQRARRYARRAARAQYAQTRVQAALRARQRLAFVRRP